MSEQAIQLIEESLKTKNPYLSLSSCDLVNKDMAEGSRIYELLKKCTHLKRLYISKNKITEINFLAHLNVLRRLDISHNELVEIKGLNKLTSLQELDISHNKLIEIGELSKLISLQQLNISYNELLETSGLDKLNSLRELDISYNELVEINAIVKLTSLQKLDISSNQISELKGLNKLTLLQQLDISNNSIIEIEGVNQLVWLEQLNISNNQIQNLSLLYNFLIRKLNPLKIIESQRRRTKFGWINTFGNPLTTPPKEVIKQGNDSIIRYLEKLASEGREQVYEAKLVLTGSGESGKTSLSLRLNDKKCSLPKSDERTKEVVVSDYHFNTKNGNDFTAHIWDFGGQQILHNFHRLFMNDSALYILITESSRENDDFDYWLQTIRLFGGDSPVLFVQNERNGVPRRLGINQYKKHFNIKDDLYEINLLDNSGLADLEYAIQKHIQQLPIVQRTIPKSWFNLRNKLEEIKVPLISYKELVYICEKCNIKKRIDIEDAGGFLHQLGSIFWYKDNLALHDKIILERHWATNALFQLVFNEKIKGQQKGYFSKSDAQEIWDADSETDYKHYTSQLIALMQEFKLAYRQRNKKDAYIIPALLPAVIPDKQFASNSRIAVVYEYLHLPRGLVNQLTAEMYEKIESDEHAWSEGVWLTDGKTEACVMENRNDRTIKVEVSGAQHRELFGAIKITLDNIHREYKGVKYEMKIPCICTSCKSNDKKHFFDYKSIIKRIEDGKKDTIECVISGEDVSLHALLDNILPAQAINEMQIYMEKEFDRIHSSLGEIDNKLSQQNELILNLLALTQASKKELTELLEKVDAQYNDDQANSLLQKVDEALAEHLDALPTRINEEWQKLNAKSNSSAEVKSKLKFKLPIIPFILDYEGEISIDMKKVREKLKGIMF